MASLRHFSDKPCPSAMTAEHRLLDKIYDLYKRLDSYTSEGNPGNSMIEKYGYFIRESEAGRRCTHAIKAKQLCLMSDLRDIERAIKDISLLLEEHKEELKFKNE